MLAKVSHPFLRGWLLTPVLGISFRADVNSFLASSLLMGPVGFSMVLFGSSSIDQDDKFETTNVSLRIACDRKMANRARHTALYVCLQFKCLIFSTLPALL